MVTIEVTLNRPESRHGLQRHLLILSVETLPVKSSLLTVGSRLGVIPALHSLFLTILLYHLQM